MTHKPWTPYEDARCRALAKQGYGVRYIAGDLGRSFDSVTNHCWLNKIKLTVNDFDVPKIVLPTNRSKYTLERIKTREVYQDECEG